MSLIDRFRGPGRPQADTGTKAAAPLPTALKPDGADPEVDLLLSQIDERLGHSASPEDSDLAESDMIVSRFVTDEELDAATPKPAAVAAAAEPTVDDAVTLPLLGHRPVAQHQRVLLTMVGAGVVGVLAIGALALSASSQQAGQLTATGQALMQSQRLAKSVSQALVGNPAAFPEVKDSSSVLVRNIKGLDAGGDGIAAVSGGARDALTSLLPMMERAEKRSADVLSQQETLTNVGQALRQINRQSSDLLEVAETVSSLKLQSGASAAELSAVGQLVMLTQRIGKSANEFLTLEGVSPEAVFLLGKDLNTFREITDGLLKGNADLRLPGTRDPATRERLEQLSVLYEQTRKQASTILGSLQGLAAAREAQSGIVQDSEPLRKGLEQVQEDLQSASGLGLLRGFAVVLAAALAVAGGLGLLRLYVFNQALRARQAEEVALKAEAQERDAKRVNDANQAAILRLMNELQTVAEGDLTHQATVTEDITGAIADSVNYTVEELRTLVAQVQNAVARVTDTTTQVEATSTELLAASSEQLREILETGESVLKMASRINEVSAQAQQTAQVARQSLAVSDTGRKAVSDTIDGMNQLRENIQETAKRIKRLGESSQEIGEITELISDITEQTNVLALNAAIQAASAGEAGRGFSVVAEEVQRLAERSGDATRQIAALVKTIQTDTQDAVAAMEQSTQGVVQNAKLSDAAGSALGDIDRVTRRLSELIEQISSEARREAESANVVAANIQHIFAVTEQTGDGTRSTAQMVHELARTADELRRSVDRFKIA
ncbi:methyl-accepting chemotaxis protein [Ideonella paludis]|uniref:Type IV pili methyl-accepting chemotaxis transducer N-terminal domain-containing protein n=1 Tax=Ideonella paludis TaxID=1233411 RepID=A0ABS5DWL6_9BURK|nr:methyl-accepting chemotaxis protein [Ideonella paludis]MBQ0935537.1 type IV pili methyl-accepting chemotaxis transducer N-terminal domain-containing protein [Ideonella paludis]